MLVIKEDVLLKLAQALEGPFNHPPLGSKYSLQELRQVKWNKLRHAEKLFRMNEAKSLINSLVEDEAFTRDYLNRLVDWDATTS